MMNQNFESPFLELPREIRDMIYDYALDWPNLEAIFSRVSTLRNRANERWRTNKLDKTEYGGRIGQYMRKITKLIQPTLITPSVLLLNRQISDEARIRLYRKTLVLPGQVSIEQHYDKLKGPAILHFMSKAALQNVQRVELRINFKPGPIGMLEASTMHSMLSPIWVERNSVQELRVVVNEPSDQGTCSRVYQYNVTAEGLTAVSHAVRIEVRRQRIDSTDVGLGATVCCRAAPDV